MESFRTAEGRGRARRPVARLVALGVAAAMAVCLLPGTALAASYYLVVTPGTATTPTYAPVYFQATEYVGTPFTGTVYTLAPATTLAATWTVSGTAAGSCDSTNPGATDANFVTGYVDCVFTSVGTATVYATWGTDVPSSATVTVTASGVAHFSVDMSAFYAIPSLTEPWDETVGIADTATVCALDPGDNTITGYLGTIRFSSTDPLAALPANYTFVAADAGCHTFSVTFGTTDIQLLIVNATADITMYGVAAVDVGLPEV